MANGDELMTAQAPAEADLFELELARIEDMLAELPEADGQLPLPGMVTVALTKDDPARASIEGALRVEARMAKYPNKGGRPKGSVNQLTRVVVGDLAKAWTMLGGASFLVRALASGDEVMRGWALRMFERSITSTNLTLAAAAYAGQGAGSGPAFFMQVQSNDPGAMDRDALTRAVSALPREELVALLAAVTRIVQEGSATDAGGEPRAEREVDGERIEPDPQAEHAALAERVRELAARGVGNLSNAELIELREGLATMKAREWT